MVLKKLNNSISSGIEGAPGFSTAKLVRAAVLLLVFAGLAWLTLQNYLVGFDRAVFMVFREKAEPYNALGPSWLQAAIRDMTALGSMICLLLFTFFGSLFLFVDRKPRTAAYFFIVIITGVVCSQLLKSEFGRLRPDLVTHANTVFTNSFPSGHAMMSAVVYLTGASMIAQTRVEARARHLLFISAFCITVLIGISRIYLGVHWPTDVIAGWIAGTAWTLLCSAFLPLLYKKQKT